MGWTIHMQPWRVLKRQTKRDSSRQELLHQIMSPSSNLISFSVQLFSFSKLFETSIVVTSRWPIAEGSSNARFWPRKMGRRWLPSTQTEDMAGRSAWLGGHRRRKTATRGKRVSFAFFTSLAVWHAFFSRARCHTASGTGLGPVPSQDGTATMSGTGSCVSGAIRGGGFAGSTLKERFQHPNWTFRTSELLVRSNKVHIPNLQFL